MNKTALKNFATSARNELIKKVEARALKIGITEEGIKKAQIESSDAIYIDGKQLSLVEKKQRDKLIQRIREIGFKNVMEEVAYTWFNRFIALRFMEVNNYLPTKVRVLSSSEPGNPEPDIIKEALSVDLDIDKELVYDLKLHNKTEELFKYLVIKQCNDLNKYLPFMFETIEDYKEILFPEGLLAKDSFLRAMTDVTAIPEYDWEQVEIIGWLYQYYIAEKKDQVFADLKKNIKISKENIPAATQLFTPHWIVRYMVENSLGRLWLESYPESPLKSEWKYFLDEAEQEQQVKDELEKIRRKNIDPESITFLDPCCGSGHILVYAFDVFYAMYLEKGYIPHEIPKLILEKNLFGLDIDDRAAQLASFAVMMKAREKSRRVFGQGIKPNICAIQESNWMTDEIIDVLVDKTASQLVQNAQRETLRHLRDAFMDAKNYGSILKVEQLDLDFLDERLKHFASDSDYQGDLLERISTSEALEKIPGLILQARIMSRKYDVVCTNPPYMGMGGMNTKLSHFVKDQYPDSKSDFFAVFIEGCAKMVKPNHFQAMITQQAWMFLSSFQKLRDKLMLMDIVNMAHLGPKAFEEIGGEVVQTTSFILRNSNVRDYKAIFIRLTDYDHASTKESKFLQGEDRYVINKERFSKIPGNPIAYWVTDNVIRIYETQKLLGEVCEPKQGLITGDNDRFLRLWYEVDLLKTSFCADMSKKWYPINKGGEFRRWYGNNQFVVNWENDGYEIKNFKDERGKLRSRPQNLDFNFRSSVSWSLVASGAFCARYYPDNSLFNVAGISCFPSDDVFKYILGLLNTKVAQSFTQIINPTINMNAGDVASVPIIISNMHKPLIDELVTKNIEISKSDWDNFETSWDFKKHPFLAHKCGTIKESFNRWKDFSDKQFEQLKSNEVELNQIFINIYGLQNELTSEIEDEHVTIRRADLERDVKSFISYAVGCMFGRYSLDEEGLVFAGGDFDPERYKTFAVDRDNILPIFSGACFEDDIVSRFVEFVKVTFGEETLAENLEFIAETLGKKDDETPREAIRKYFLNDFFKDHVQTYKKKPIYWLFTSGKQKAFNCLIYMHRYDKTTLSRIRTDYVHELQIRLDAEKKSLLSIIEGGGTPKEVSTAKKELKTLDLKIAEFKEYEELLHHMADRQIEIDLDDGVDVNYAKFEGLLAKRN
ncbi:BREX-1 system adenine-specific DNA-methyltransferase PglX [Alicyclobacillus acidiphilus]|uniref:BREX-1 system adenine-specific DNA-methyltransferase PglX n=1 Tax=Alicyclobacillus acidiphilus TaxID=182455 RepID=UPI000833D413|nr:BREX-1 system adenine-specific DNA-methyltransferase PglX [Alicyclobacillus acidiphilus]